MMPVFGQLVSFGSFRFDPNKSYISQVPRKRNRRYANLLGQAYPVDAHAGGVTPYASTECTWIYWIVAPEGTAEAQCPVFVEAQYNALEALVNATNTDGTSGEVQTLTVAMADGAHVSCTAALVDYPIREQDRNYSSMSLNLIFALYGAFK